MENWLIALIVIASISVFIVLLYFVLRWYTWRRVRILNPSIPRVKIDSYEYAGTWYEIGHNPEWFEKGCTNTTANYEVLPSGIQVKNKCFTNGAWKESVGMAYPTEHDGVLGVSFFPGIYGNYTVTYRDPQTSIVTNQQGTSLWILSRSRDISQQEKHRLQEWLIEHEFNLSKFQWTKTLTHSEIDALTTHA